MTGRLFAIQVFLGDALYEIDTSGENPPRRIMEGMGGLNGFEFGPDGWLYGPLWFKGRVVRVNVDTAGMQTVADGFRIPAAVNFDADGSLYVVDTRTGELIRVDVSSGRKILVAQLRPSLDNLAVDRRRGLIYVSNMADNAIHEVNPATGEMRTVVDIRLAAPGGLALMGDLLYIADIFAFRTLDTGNGDVSEVARMWASHLEYPTNATANGSTVVLSSWATGTVQGFQAPYDALELGDGSLLVAELTTGQLLRVSGEEGENRQAVVTGLQGPAGLVLSGDGGTVYATTTGGRVWAIDTADWSKRLVVEGLALPEGIDLTPEGRLVVVETGARRILEMDPANGDFRVAAADLPIGLPSLEGLPSTGLFNDVAVSASGDLYFTADVKAGLYRIPRL